MSRLPRSDWRNHFGRTEGENRPSVRDVSGSTLEPLLHRGLKVTFWGSLTVWCEEDESRTVPIEAAFSVGAWTRRHNRSRRLDFQLAAKPRSRICNRPSPRGPKYSVNRSPEWGHRFSVFCCRFLLAICGGPHF